MPRVAIITNVIPHYRLAFYQRLEEAGLDYTVFCQDHLPGFNLRLVHNQLENVHLVRSLGSERRVVWQFLPVLRLLAYDVLVFYGNPRVLSTVVWATLLHLLGKRVILWGQAHGAYSDGWSERVRLAWWRLFDSVLVYTDREAEQLRAAGFGRVVGLNNGLDQRAIDREASKWGNGRLAQWQQMQALDGRRVILSCGRLTMDKRFELVAEAVWRLRLQFPDLLWCIIGDGPEREFFEAYNSELAPRIRWLGAVYDEAELAPWFLTARAFIHAGPVGLSLLHAFGYGLPAIIHDVPAGHGPEVAAFRHGVNGLSFRRASMHSLAAVIAAILDKPALREHLGYAARETARERYNVDVMARRFLKEIGHGD